MKDEQIKLLDIVALLKEMPEKRLSRGQIGTIVEKYSATDFEVEFSDNSGRTICLLMLTTDDVMVLHNELSIA